MVNGKMASESKLWPAFGAVLVDWPVRRRGTMRRPAATAMPASAQAVKIQTVAGCLVDGSGFDRALVMLESLKMALSAKAKSRAD